jgi:hypothetical protein
MNQTDGEIGTSLAWDRFDSLSRPRQHQAFSLNNRRQLEQLQQ